MISTSPCLNACNSDRLFESPSRMTKVDFHGTRSEIDLTANFQKQPTKKGELSAWQQGQTSTRCGCCS